MENLYYKPVTDDTFQEIKDAVTAIWQTYDDTYGYATSKIERIKDKNNIQDNGMYMVAMFDMNNQRKLASLLSEEAKQEIRERLVAGGSIEYLTMF